MTAIPPGYSYNPNRAVQIASRDAKVGHAVAGAGGKLVASPALFGGGEYLVRFYNGRKLVVEVNLNGRTGAIRWADEGREIDWPPVWHGHHGARSRALHWALVITGLLFLIPFVDRRRPFRLLHLDLLAIASLGISYGFAEAGQIYTSTPLMYPSLLYLLVRAVTLALGARSADQGPLTWASSKLLARGLVVLLALRFGWVIAEGLVRDIGYASSFGADSLIHGDPIYTTGNPLDAYGPFMYLAYVPFVIAWPLTNLSHANVGSATAAALAFDLGVVTCLYLLGSRLRDGADGRKLGLCLAWAYAACPWSLLVISDGTNDGLVALLLVVLLFVLAKPAWRGFVLGLAVAAKFAPLVLAAAFARTERRVRARPFLVYSGVLALTVIALVAVLLYGSSVETFWGSTIKFQATRTAPFSMWGLHPAWEPVKWVVAGLAAVMGAAAFFIPRERSLERLAATGAALLIAVELTAVYWYWYYVVWFLPYLLIALFSRSYAGNVRNSGSSSASAVASNKS